MQNRKRESKLTLKKLISLPSVWLMIFFKNALLSEHFLHRYLHVDNYN